MKTRQNVQALLNLMAQVYYDEDVSEELVKALTTINADLEQTAKKLERACTDSVADIWLGRKDGEDKK